LVMDGFDTDLVFAMVRNSTGMLPYDGFAYIQ
jgi:hypothetical protein